MPPACRWRGSGAASLAWQGPGSVFLATTGMSGAKPLDFGLAKLKDPGAEATRALDRGVARLQAQASAAPTDCAPLTQEGCLVGTVQYMAPEQLEGREADQRTDIFSFGCVLYEMTTGRKAFEGKTQASLIGSILLSEPPSMTSAKPSWSRRIILPCSAKSSWRPTTLYVRTGLAKPLTVSATPSSASTVSLTREWVS